MSEPFFSVLVSNAALSIVVLAVIIAANGLFLLYMRNRYRTRLLKLELKAGKTEQSLMEHLEIVRKLLDQVPDPILFKNADGQYAHCNRELECLWGVSRENIIGRTPDDFFPDQAEEFKKLDTIVKVRDRTVRKEKWLTDSQGHIRYFEIHQMPFFSGKGEQPGILIFFRDVTSFKEELTSLNQLHESIKRDLQERALFYSQFLKKAVIPLEEIKENTERVMDSLEQGRDSDSSLRKIIQASYLMDSYIRNLAFLAFPDKSAYPSIFTEDAGFSMEDWQNALNERCRGYSAKTGKSSFVLLQGDVPESLSLDFRILNDLMEKLIENAESHAAGGFYVVIRINRVEGEHFSMNISVRNTGPSIPSAQREDIFKPFFQLEGENKERTAGLGLTVARSLAQRLGGSLSCDPSCSDGARFLLSLPPRAGHGTIISGNRLEGNRQGRPERILLADDDEGFRTRLASQLTRAGFAVIEADNGRDALVAARREIPDLLLLDRKMPLMTGMDVAKQVSREPDLADAQCWLLTSSYLMEEELLYPENLEFSGYLSKPLDWGLFLDILIRKE